MSDEINYDNVLKILRETEIVEGFPVSVTVRGHELLKFSVADGARYMAAWVFRELAGFTYKEIGRLVGRADDKTVPVSRERARQMVALGDRFMISAWWADRRDG